MNINVYINVLYLQSPVFITSQWIDPAILDGGENENSENSHAELQHPDFQQLLVRHAHLHLGARVVAEFDTLRGWDFLGTS